MKLKIKDKKVPTCEIWLKPSEEEIDIMVIDEEGRELTIATIKVNKTLMIYESSGFKFEK